MTTTAESMGAVIIRPRSRGVRSFFTDTLLLTRRNLLLTARTPELVVFAAIMPIMFVLLFRYVFGGSIRVPGYTSYVDYLMPGIIVQTALFGGSS
jgi:ABC-2 type transport system permease protein